MIEENSELFDRMKTVVEWRNIPGFPQYLINRKGDIRIKVTYGSPLAIKPFTEHDGSLAIKLWVVSDYVTRSVSDLTRKAYPDSSETKKSKLYNALRDELKHTPNTYGMYSLNDLIASKLVERIIKEGWHPNGECDS
jgi:hypothetical protein